MEKHADKAVRLFREGCNCAQAVVVAFCDLTGLDEVTAIKLASSFGGGMGRMREVCGAVSGALMVLGMLRAPAAPANQETKAAHYALVQELAARFRACHSTIICRELLGDQAGTGHVPAARTPEYYAMRPCERFVHDAAKILEGMLEE